MSNNDDSKPKVNDMVSGRPTLRASIALLEGAGLPSGDLTPAHLEHFFYCGAEAAPTGMVGVELYGADALLRSLVVSQGARRKGLATALLEHVEDYARAQGVRVMYLLTSTAESFFEQQGYQRISRTEVAPAIQATREFQDLCPQSSTLMTKAF
jgi:amino-acid N-acetyltransferase